MAYCDKGFFIVFEGIDGSGSSTQARLLYEYLLSNSLVGKKAVLTAEPTFGPVGQVIKSIMQGRLVTCMDNKMDDRLLAYLFAADRHDHLYNAVNGIAKRLNEQYAVISTRYYLSSLAYHVSDNADYRFVYSLNKNFPNPNIIFYLECPVDVAIERLKKREHLEKYENKEKLLMVERNYQEAISHYKDVLYKIDGAKSIKDIHSKIVRIVHKLLVSRQLSSVG